MSATEEWHQLHARGEHVKNYGALAGVVLMLLWQFLTALSILVGAELNGELERQRAMTAAEDERS